MATFRGLYFAQIFLFRSKRSFLDLSFQYFLLKWKYFGLQLSEGCSILLKFLLRQESSSQILLETADYSLCRAESAESAMLKLF